jgi:LysR family transcriptional regulator, regulator for bpeEF and oprC
MDKLRALQYFVAAAEEESLSGAARRHDVSIAAVSKLVGGLERSLGARLFDRGPQGLVLTADGSRYLQACQPLLHQLEEADEAISAAAGKAKGLLVVGAPAFVLQNFLGPSLLRFHARYPEIDLDFRIVNGPGDAEAEGVEVFVLFGWHEMPDHVQKPIAQNLYTVVASPAYWEAQGTPTRPRDLEAHQCFAFRSPQRVLLDVWDFERGAEKESVRARGWLASSHRNMLLDAALAGQGVVRSTDLIALPLLRSGRLRAVLQDWHGLHAPPANVIFRPQHRRTPRVRAFVDHVVEIFRRVEAERGEHSVAPVERPHWHDARLGRHPSSLLMPTHSRNKATR